MTRILVVEDSPTQALALTSHLEQAGYEVVGAKHGEDALERLATDPVDLVLSDVVMPGQVDGYELCRRIKATSRHDIPVILLTSLSDPMDIIRGLECGADNFLTKPYEPHVLVARIETLLETRRRRARERREGGVGVYFLGREYVITSRPEQILDLLITTFEEAVQHNRELRRREEELTAARAELARYAGSLEGMLQAILDHSPAVIYVKDAEQRFTFVNRQFEAVFGVTRVQAVGETDGDLLGEEIARVLRANEGQVLRDGVAAPFDEVVPQGDGPHTYLSVKFPVGAGAIGSISTDITDRKRAEASLLARARQQAAVAELGQYAVEETDTQTLMDEAVTVVRRTLDVDMSMVLQLQSSKELLLRAGVGVREGLVGTATVAVSADSQAAYTLSVNHPVTVADLRTESRFRGADLLLSHGAISGVSVLIPGQRRPFGVLTGHTTTLHDFTTDDANFLQSVANILAAAIERDGSEQAFRRSQRLEAIGRLSGGIAHDFNNVLTAITGYGQFVLAALPDSSPVADDAREIIKAANRAAALTRQLLAFSRRQTLKPTVLDLNSVLADMRNMLRRTIGDDIELTVMPAAVGRVLADPSQVEQVVLNLVVNARDAMPAGGKLTIETADVELDDLYAADHVSVEPGPHVMLAVSDTGIGMDQATLAHIFEPFFTTKGPEQGTGLGLATVYGIVKQSGGNVWAYSELGRGATFKVFLPRTVGELDERTPDTVGAIPTGTETILLVEDEETVRRVAERALRRAGFEVLAAANGEEALAVAESHGDRVQLLLTDVLMPRMSGPELADRLRAARPDLPVLFMSGFTDAAAGQHGLIDGDATLLSKPFTAESLVQHVRRALDRAG